MLSRRKLAVALGVTAVAVSLGVTTMVTRHQSTITPAHSRVRADALGTDGGVLTDAAMSKALRDAGVPATVEVRSSGDIVILRGVADSAAATQAVAVVKSLGAKRVANLITAESATDDEGIRREAERHLTMTRALDGCRIAVSCNRGVLRVSGTVQSELQKDAARVAVRNVAGARGVELDLAVATASM